MEYTLINPINPDYSVIEQILTNRGFKQEDIAHYLNTTDDDILPPSLINYIHDGAMMLMKHLKNESNIYCIVDSDCDGFCAAAILLNYIHLILPSIAKSKIIYDFHEGKEHGIELDRISDDIQLVIALDSSSNDYNIHETLFNKGIDVLCIDHHEAEKVSKYACVINNQLDDYPTKSLSGAAMTYKFCQYLDHLFQLDNADNFLDLTALSLISDMMDLQDFETRRLIEKGLENIRNPFFKAMVDKQAYSLGSELTPIGIAFYIAPYINAINRVGSQEEKQLLFESMLEWLSYKMIPSTKRGCKGMTETVVEQAIRNCVNIKNRQGRLKDEGLEQVENQIKEQCLLDHKILVVALQDNAIDKNIIGLLANQLLGKYKRPTIILNKYDDLYAGSLRGPAHSKLPDLRQFVEDSSFSEYAQGHACAAGCAFTADNLPKFIEYANNTLQDMDFSPSYKVDFIYSYNDVKPQDICDIANLKSYWGQNIEESLVVIENVKITSKNLFLMGINKNKPTIKIILPNNLNCIKFKASEEEYNNLYSEQGCVTVNLICTCNLNEFNGKITPQLFIQDYEIINSQQYYF